MRQAQLSGQVIVNTNGAQIMRIQNGDPSNHQIVHIIQNHHP